MARAVEFQRGQESSGKKHKHFPKHPHLLMMGMLLGRLFGKFGAQDCKPAQQLPAFNKKMAQACPGSSSTLKIVSIVRAVLPLSSWSGNTHSYASKYPPVLMLAGSALFWCQGPDPHRKDAPGHLFQNKLQISKQVSKS